MVWPLVLGAVIGAGARACSSVSEAFVTPVLPKKENRVVEMVITPSVRFARFRGNPSPCHLVIETFDELRPVVCRNFLELCKGSQGRNSRGHALTYVGTTLDVRDGNLYGGNVGGDESTPVGCAAYSALLAIDGGGAQLNVSHTKGLVYMCLDHSRRNVGSCFAIQVQQQMDRHGLYPFGQVVRGMDDVERLVSKYKTARIIACNVLPAHRRGELSKQ